MLKPSISDLIKSSFRSIFKNKSRTILTSLGIIIGVTSVILLTSIGNGLTIYVNQQFESLGSNTIFVTPGKVFNDKGTFSASSSRSSMVTTSFTEKNISDLKRNLKTNLVLPMTTLSAEIKSINAKKTTTIVGTNYLYGPNNNTLPSANNGRWFTKDEDDKKDDVAVLGATIAKDLFPNGNALGKKIVFKGKNFKVIGVIDKKGSSFGGPSLDDYIYVPIGVAFEINGNQNIQLKPLTKPKSTLPKNK